MKREAYLMLFRHEFFNHLTKIGFESFPLPIGVNDYPTYN